MKRILPSLLVGVPLLAVPTLASAQLNVPLSECSCTFPVDINRCCKAVANTCTRTDSAPVIIAAGTPVVVQSTGHCENCGGCPCNPPSNPMTCDSAASIAETETATATISSQVTVGIPGIEASGAALGVAIGTTVTITQTCSIIASPCEKAGVVASLTVTRGRKAKIDHSWHVAGTWTNTCWFSTCPITGFAWQQACGTGTSTGIATLVGNGTCSSLPTQACP